MNDVVGLILKLRKMGHLMPTCEAAADMIEQQAKRIAELEAVIPDKEVK